MRPSPRELWLEERCKYLETCLEALGVKTDPESFYAFRDSLIAESLSPSVHMAMPRPPVHAVPWAVSVEAERLDSFGWEVTVRTNRTATRDYYGIAVHADPLRYEGQLMEYAESLIEEMMHTLAGAFWGRTSK